MNQISAAARSQQGFKPLSYSAIGRILIVTPMVVLLWLAIYWAVLLP